MKKLTTLFIVAVLGPSLVLAWLATRSLKDQEMVMRDQVERRAEGMTATVAQDVNVFMDDVRLFYRQQVDALVKENHGNFKTNWLQDFDQSIRSRWGQVKVGTVIDGDGKVYAPLAKSQDLRVRNFLQDNNTFFTNKAVWEVYRAPARQSNDVLAVQTDEPAKQDESASSWVSVAASSPVSIPAMQKQSASLGESVVEEKREPEKEGEGKMARVKSIAPAKKQKPSSQPTSSARTESLTLKDESQAKLMKGKKKVAMKSAETKKATVSRRISQAPASPPSSFAKNDQQKPVQQKVAVGQLNVAPQYSKLRSQSKGQVMGGRGIITSPGVESEEMIPMENRDENRPMEQSAVETGGLIAGKKINDLLQREVGLEGERKRAKQGMGNDRDDLTKNMAMDQVQLPEPFADLETDSGVMQDVIGQEREGALGRFLDDGLHLYLWYRPEVLKSKIFWVELDLNEIRRELQGIITGVDFSDSEAFCLALLDERGQLVGKNKQSFHSDWAKSLVNSEVGSILPRWMVAAYLVNPTELARSARSLHLTILLLVGFLIVAIGIGGWLIIKETGREMYLARQKTDFVSNVSHELKTPLTSIRMFSELLGKTGNVDDDKRVEYAGIIDNETGRLTRLINQLLDFSRLERGGKRYDFEELDVAALIKETVENYRHRLEADGAKLSIQDRSEGNATLVKGDKDALSQIILNLLSNAEKYGGSSPVIDVEIKALDEEAVVEIRVKDRGKGISRRDSARIFEKFYRVDDSLASGIEGSGLGLSLARQLARAHDGDLLYRSRKKGGSCFVLSLPVCRKS